VIVPIVQLNVAPATLLVKAILVAAPVHIVVGPVAVTFGVGLTVTTILVRLPLQELATGVTIYVTVPAVVPRLVRVWAIVVPFDAVAPAIAPVTGPIVQLKVAPETLLVKAIFVVAPLHIVVGLAVVTFGVGLTVITMLTGAPGQEFAVGVTIYVTEPAVVPELVRAWAIVAPEEEVAPVIPPVTAPIVQLNVVPVTLLLNAIFVVAPLQMVVGPVDVKFGAGLTVTTMVVGVPVHELAVGVTVYVTVPAAVPGLISIWAIVAPPDELAPVIPPVTEPTVQLKAAPATLLVNAILVVVALQIVVGLTVVTFGTGLTTTATSYVVGLVHPFAVNV
jgi:hypothetical protein